MWLCLFFIIGILTLCPLAEKPVIYISIAFAIGFLFACLRRRKPIFALLLCVAFVTGSFVMYFDIAKDHTFSKWTDGKRIICGKVVDSYISGENAVNVVETESVDYQEVKSKVRIYTKDGSLFDYGDEIYAVGRLSVPQKPRKKTDVDFRAYNFSRGIYANCFAESWAVRLVEEGDVAFNLEKLGMYSRRSIKQKINQLFPMEEAGVLTALMLGDKSGISDEFSDVGSKVGISHTMATSGLHVSILLTFFGLFVSRIGRRKVAPCINIALLVVIYVVIGYSPSISRAVIMNMLMSIAQLTDSKADSYTSLALSAVIILMLSPYALFDVGFLLSFASTLGILIIYQKFSRVVDNKALTILLMSLAAILGTGGLTVFYFGRLTLLGAVSNIIIVPLAEFILPLGYISVIISMICFPIGKFISGSVYLLVKAFMFIAELFAKLPFASVQVPKLPAYVVLIITVGIFALFAYIPAKGDLYEGRTIKKRHTKQPTREPLRLRGGGGISCPELSAEIPGHSSSGDEGI